MAWSKVTWYSLGFNIASKQCYFYYGLEGDNSAHQIFVTAPQLSALAEMFRNEAPITYNGDGHYFVSNHEAVAQSAAIRRADQPPGVTSPDS